jgi:hypothetical protein
MVMICMAWTISIRNIKKVSKILNDILTLKVEPIVPNLFEAFRPSIELSKTVSAPLEIRKKHLNEPHYPGANERFKFHVHNDKKIIFDHPN